MVAEELKSKVVEVDELKMRLLDIVVSPLLVHRPNLYPGSELKCPKSKEMIDDLIGKEIYRGIVRLLC